MPSTIRRIFGVLAGASELLRLNRERESIYPMLNSDTPHDTFQLAEIPTLQTA